MKSWIVHYKNKYPGAMIDMGARHFKVILNGEIKLSMYKNGHDMWVCESEEEVLKERHDLSPIPRDTRVWKLDSKNKIIRDELADEREVVGRALLKHLGKVPSIPELKKMLNPKFIESSNTDHKWELLPELKKLAESGSLVARELSDKLLDAPSVSKDALTESGIESDGVLPA